MRESDITIAQFNRRIPMAVNPDQAVGIEVKKHTGIVIFCAQVERSMYQPEDIAIFMPVEIMINGLSLPFLARLYFDGAKKKLGFISSADFILPNIGEEEPRRIWSGFIYTLPRHQVELRKRIISAMIEGSNKKSDGFKILQPINLSLETISLRPARPLDIRELKTHLNLMHPVLQESLHNVLS